MSDTQERITAPPRSAPSNGDRALTPEQLGEMLALLKGADSVELKLSVPDYNRRSTVAALDLDPIAAQIRQVMFFDTPDLALNRAGVVVRARRVQAREGDTVVKLRPVVPSELPSSIRKSPMFGVEVDAMPGGYVCSASFKGRRDDADVKAVFQGDKSIKKLLTKEQRAFYESHAPDGLGLDDLMRLGPILVLKLKFTPKDFQAPMVAELWIYPDGGRILELSTKCQPKEAFDYAAQVKAYLGTRGVDLLAEQQTKTRTALEFFASELAGGEQR